MIVGRLVALIALFSLACTAAAPAASLKGALGEPGIVWISDGAVQKPVEVEMHNIHKSFEPTVTIVPLHSSVRFPNDDSFFHSIYAASGPNQFDIGFYGTGPGKLVAFDRVGVDVVRCHIHAGMLAIVAAVDGPSMSTATTAFELPGVRPGTHVLHAWGESMGERTRSVTIPKEGELTLEKTL